METDVRFSVSRTPRGNYAVSKLSMNNGVPSVMQLKVFAKKEVAEAFKKKVEEGTMSTSNRYNTVAEEIAATTCTCFNGKVSKTCSVHGYGREMTPVPKDGKCVECGSILTDEFPNVEYIGCDGCPRIYARVKKVQ